MGTNANLAARAANAESIALDLGFLEPCAQHPDVLLDSGQFSESVVEAEVDRLIEAHDPRVTLAERELMLVAISYACDMTGDACAACEDNWHE